MSLEFKGTKELKSKTVAMEKPLEDCKVTKIMSRNGNKVYATVNATHKEPGKSNAKLFEASYDLLEALHEMNEFCKSLDVWASNKNTAGLYPAIEKAEKAINKATK